MRKQIFNALLIFSLLLAASAESVAALSSTSGLAQAQGQVFTPVEDTYVLSTKPTTNYGSRINLKTDNSPLEYIYLKFNVQGVGVAPSAALRFYAESSNTQGLNIHTVSNTSWNEGTMVWNNAPPIGPSVAFTGPIVAGNWYLIDISSAITGDGLVSLAITNPNNTAATITSSEGSNPPELYVPIPVPVSPSPFVVRRDGNTYHAESQTTSSSYSGSLKFVVESAAYELDSYGTGGTITFLAGDFDLGADWFKLDNVNDITFEGQGIDVTILRNNTSAAADTEPFNCTNCDRLTIHDMTVSAGGSVRSTSDAFDFDAGDNNVVERVKITASRGRGIVFDGKDVANGQPRTADGNIVRDCVITGISSDGIELLASNFNLIENCQISNVGGHGIQITKSSATAGQPHKKSNDNVISGNFIDNAGQDGINLISGDRNTLTGNTILNSSDDITNQDGIQITSSDSIACNDNVVEFNSATDNQAVKTQRYGLSISSSLCNRTVVGDNNFTGNLVGDIQDLGTNTIYGSTDSQPPTVPTGLATTLVTHNQVDLVWNASTDNVGVTSYTIYRGGAPVGTVNGATTAFQDGTVNPNTTYDYTVEAFDAAGNNSGQSAPLQVTTPSAPPDSEPPSVPTNLTATNVTYLAVDLAWNPSTDNMGVTSYTIYRDGSPLNSVNGATLTYQDNTVAPNASYNYTVEAFDAAGNGSGQSAALPVTTPSAPSTFTFIPISDSYVNGASPATNYGTNTALRADGSPIVNSYLRFDVQGVAGSVTRATLRVYANSASSLGCDAQSVNDNTWGELTITYNNAPPVGGVLGSSGAFGAGVWISIDVTSYITGNGIYNLALTTPSSTAISFASRESSANAPQLIIETSP